MPARGAGIVLSSLITNRKKPIAQASRGSAARFQIPDNYQRTIERHSRHLRTACTLEPTQLAKLPGMAFRYPLRVAPTPIIMRGNCSRKPVTYQILTSLTGVRHVIESGSQPRWLSVAEASRKLGITETAVRKRIRVGSLPSRGQRGETQVLIVAGAEGRPSSQPLPALLPTNAEVSRLVGELSELRARLADAQLDRDRWHAAAVAAREDARLAAVARDAAERELRMLLGRS
jgi:hypothetical protein